MLSPLTILDGWKGPSSPQARSSTTNKTRINFKDLEDLSFDNTSQNFPEVPDNCAKNQNAEEMNGLRLRLLTRTGVNISRISLASTLVSRASTNISCQQSITSQYEEFKDADLLSLNMFLNQKVLSSQQLISNKNNNRQSYKELFWRSDREVREKYLQTLKHKNILGSKYPTKLQSFVIFDWEGALFCGSDLEEIKGNDFSLKGKPSLRSLDRAISSLLEEIAFYSQVLILTTCNESTVHYSAQLYLPFTHKVLVTEKIQVISTRSPEYNKGGLSAMKTIFKPEIPTNIMCAVQSDVKAAAIETLGKDLRTNMVKIVKFKENSKVAELIKQQEVFLKQFENMFYELKGLTLQLAKKKV